MITKKTNFEYIGLIILSFFPIFPFFLVSLSVIAYVLLALLSKFVSKRNFQKRDYTIISLHILFYLLLIIRLFFTDNFIEGFQHLQPSLSLLAFPIVWFISSTSLSNKERDNILKCFTLSSFILALLILFFSIYIAFTTNKEFIIYYEEIKYLDIHPNYVALYFLAAILFLYLTLNKRSRKVKVISQLFIFFFIAMILALSSRIVIILLVIIGLFELFKRIKAPLNKKIIILLVSFIILVSSTLLIKPLHKKLKETINLNELVLPYKKFPTSTQIRLGIYECAFPIIKKNWLVGTGGINFEREINACYESYNNYQKINYNSHNYYLYLIGSAGIFCLILFLVLLFYHFKRAIYHKDFFYGYILLALVITLFTENFLSRVYGVVFIMFFLTVFMKSTIQEENEK
jgi:hypothetical protein